MTCDPVLRFRLILPLTPKGKGRARSGQGRMYTPKTTRDYEAAIRAAAILAWKEEAAMTGPLHMTVNAFMPLPAKAKGRTHHTQKPDLDNIVKAVKDALNPQRKKVRGEWVTVWHGVYADDCQVVRCLSAKQWAVDGLLTVSIWSVT